MLQEQFPSILEGHWQFLLCLVPLLVVSLQYILYYYKVLFDAAQVRALSDLVSLTELALCFCLSSVSEQKAQRNIACSKLSTQKSKLHTYLKLCDFLRFQIQQTLQKILPSFTNPRAFVCKESLCATPLPSRVLCTYIYQDYIYCCCY